MNVHTGEQENTTIKKAVWIGTISLLGLLLLFFVVTFFQHQSSDFTNKPIDRTSFCSQ